MSNGNTGEHRSSSNNESNFEPFHSAVNRIPLLRKKTKSLGNKVWNRKQKHRTRGQLTREQTGREHEKIGTRNAVGAFAKTIFHDGVAEGHDRLKPDRWWGSIDVEMTVHTPLVYGGQDDREGNEAPQDQHSQKDRHDKKDEDHRQGNSHKRKPPISVPTYPAVYGQAPTDFSGDSATDIENVSQKKLPFMSPTMVKGMISRAYETLTASRFRVFGSQSPDADTDHRTRLTYRAGRSKKSYKKSPWDLAKDQWALPLSKAKEASAADRLFGYVIQKNNKHDNPEETDSKSAPSGTALRGRLTFGPVKILGPRPNPQEPAGSAIKRLGGPHPLPPLLEPKPSSARRFITDEEGKTPFDAGAPPSGSTSTPGSAAASGSTSAKANAPNSSRQAIARSECFSRGQFLGIAAYPVHRCRLGRNELPSASGQVLANGKETEENVKVSLAVDSFIRAGSVLRCRIRFTDLAQEELAALLWVLTPENFVPQSERNKHAHAESEGNTTQPSATKPPIGYLRMGLGKPFGLGAIEARATSMTAHKGEDLAERYESLDGCLGHRPTGPEISSPSIADFSSALDDYKLDEQPWVQAMQRAAYGYDDGVEVRYMSLDENKANNQTDNKGNPKHARLEDGSYEERGVSPTDLFSPGPDFEAYRPAPINISVTKKNDQKNRNGQRGHKSDTKDSRRGSNNNSTRNSSSARRSRRKRGQTR